MNSTVAVLGSSSGKSGRGDLARPVGKAPARQDPDGSDGRSPRLLGAVLGTVAGYIAVIGWSAQLLGRRDLRSRQRSVESLFFIVVAMPLLAVAAGWLLAGREPPAMAHQPLD
jgi:putative ABC transport system permease protein